MANRKLIVNGEIADKKFPITTTETIYDNLVSESFEKNISMNFIVNKILSSWANRRMKTKSPNNKKP